MTTWGRVLSFHALSVDAAIWALHVDALLASTSAARHWLSRWPHLPYASTRLLVTLRSGISPEPCALSPRVRRKVIATATTGSISSNRLARHCSSRSTLTVSAAVACERYTNADQPQLSRSRKHRQRNPSTSLQTTQTPQRPRKKSLQRNQSGPMKTPAPRMLSG